MSKHAQTQTDLYTELSAEVSRLLLLWVQADSAAELALKTLRANADKVERMTEKLGAMNQTLTEQRNELARLRHLRGRVMLVADNEGSAGRRAKAKGRAE